MAAMLNQPILINVLGHAAGALIFAIFLVQLYSGRGWSGGGRYLSGWPQACRWCGTWDPSSCSPGPPFHRGF